MTNKTETDVEKLVDKFNQWANDRIIDLNHLPPSHGIRLRSKAGIDMLNWAKRNLERLAKEESDGIGN